jgi:hypothetical protein
MGMKDVVKRVKKAMKAYAAPPRSEELIKWQKRLETAKAGQDLGLMDKREFLYMGDRRVDKNINDTTNPSKMANNIWNIVYEFIESQVSSQIPMPQVKSKREEFELQAQMIAESIANDLKESTIDEINDMNERITPLQGFSLVEVAWNPDFKHHLYRGEIELHGRHPKQFVGQPKVYNLQKMDYFFILSDVSQEYVMRRYKKNLTGEEEQYPENTRLFDDGLLSTNGVTQRSGGEEDEEPLTEIVCWYKDEEGDYGKFVWINDIELENLPQYFYRRINGKIQTEETLQEDVISVIDGSVIASAGEVVPYFVPQRYPVSVRINVPRNFAFGGQSDLDVIRDQQDSIKRVVHKMEEKLVKGGSIIKALDTHNTFVIDETINQIIRGSQQELAAIGVENLVADISADIEYVREQYRMAQSMLGITNSFQGKEDTTAQSGKAKQIQVQQASGRMQSKQFNKYVHYKEIFEIIFEFKLALYDEIRPYLAQDANGQDTFGQFDKYQFLQRDKTGKLYYNTDFIFGSDGSMGLPKDPMFLYNQALALFQAQAMDAQALWTLLESLDFPQAAKIKKQVMDKIQQQAQQADLQQQIPQMQQQYEEKIQQDQQEIEVLNEMVKMLHEAVQEAQQGDMQAMNETLKQLEEVQAKEHQQGLEMQKQQMAQEQQAHGQEMDRQKLEIEAQKVQTMGQRQAVGSGQE